MVKEETPRTSRRTTRLSSSGTPNSKCAEEPSKSTHTSSVKDLVFHGESITLDELITSFPGRKVQILELINYLGPLNSPMIPLFVYGAASTGKTSLTLNIFNHLKRPFVYCSFITCYSPRILFESILNQILLHRKNESTGYSSAKRCEKPSDFVNLLRQALSSRIENLKQNLEKSGPKKPSSQVNDTGYAEPFPIHFPEYTEKDLRNILLKNQSNPKLYSSFLDLVLRPFYRTTRRVDELVTAIAPLFKRYCEPLSDPRTVPNEDTKRKLYSYLQPFIMHSLNETFMVSSDPLLKATAEKDRATRKSVAKIRRSSETVDEIDFQMSTSAKYLLISAFLASRNPATLDASLFDSTGGSSNRKRKRKASEKSMDQKETKSQESIMKGPGTFPLERLLAIFQCITSVAEDLADDGELKNGGIEDQGYESELMPDVLLQLSSLCSANFVTKGGSCPLEGSTRYRSSVSEDLALKVARSLKFPLSKYLYRS
ncbi:origin of replication complex subunit 5 isoform X2 [Andrographis paniculata]|uniref:origin of replication complex subunit 5 isoform X2 n=1 Tax=Andrographis paniculata TaxID=175694 RepID=UPI0021E857CB|nr:origin of replication complex subunit 5 isoform X2 [Andrographis paniculata]